MNKEDLLNKYIIISKEKNRNMKGQLNNTFNADEALIFITNIEELYTHAGFKITFKPICGDFNNIIKNAIGLSTTKYEGMISYFTFTSLVENLKNEYLPETLLNKSVESK